VNYYKIVADGYVLQVGSGVFADAITESEYNGLLAIIRSAPTAPSGYTYKLRADTLEWELLELPPEPDPGEEDATAEDYEAALSDLGVKL
jgi:hypothetical protein